MRSSPPGGRQPVRQLETEHGGTALAVTADVTDPTARQAVVAAAMERFGHIDVLANIDGQGWLGASEGFSIEQFREQMELNFFAAALTREVLPSIRAQGSGHILNLTSIGGLVAIRGFHRLLRYEVRPLGLE